jgi:hypothetical protein
MLPGAESEYDALSLMAPLDESVIAPLPPDAVMLAASPKFPLLADKLTKLTPVIVAPTFWLMLPLFEFKVIALPAESEPPTVSEVVAPDVITWMLPEEELLAFSSTVPVPMVSVTFASFLELRVIEVAVVFAMLMAPFVLVTLSTGVETRLPSVTSPLPFMTIELAAVRLKFVLTVEPVEVMLILSEVIMLPFSRNAPLEINVA